MNTLKDYVNFKLTHADKVAEAEGYPLKMENCKKYKKMRDLEIYGNSFQDGTPTPDNPIEVVSVGDKTKNLIPFPYANMSATHNGVTFTVNNDGTIVANGTATGGNAYIIICRAGDNPFPTGTYTMSGAPTADTYMMFSGISVSCNSGQSITFTIEEGQAQNFITCCVYAGRTVNNVVFKPMIQEGNTATPYEPYGKYKIPVVQRGINLFSMAKSNFTTTTINGITYTPLGDERVHIKGKLADTTKSAYYQPSMKSRYFIKAGKYRAKPNNYTWSGLTLLYQIRKDGNFMVNINTTVSAVNVPEDGYINNIFIGVDAGNTREWDDIIELQLMEGTEDLPYEPYVEPVTTNIFLDEPLNDGDYIDFKNKKAVYYGNEIITELPLNIELPKPIAKTTIIEVDTSLAPSNAYGKYIKK